MTIISQSYAIIKKEAGVEFARKVLLETYDHLEENVKATAKAVQCNRRMVYLALEKQEKKDLSDGSHAPHNVYGKSPVELEEIIEKRRQDTGFGKRRLRWYIREIDKQLIPESTIGAVLKRRGLARKKKRIRRESQTWYAWETLLPFEEYQLDTKEIADADTLPKEVYQYFINKPLPRWQWTFTDVKTRIRVLNWSYSRDWACGQVFVSLVRPHMGIGDITPYQKLKSLGHTTPEAFCIFPTFILDHLAVSPTVFTRKSVQDPIDYDPNVNQC